MWGRVSSDQAPDHDEIYQFEVATRASTSRFTTDAHAPRGRRMPLAECPRAPCRAPATAALGAAREGETLIGSPRWAKGSRDDHGLQRGV